MGRYPPEEIAHDKRRTNRFHRVHGHSLHLMGAEEMVKDVGHDRWPTKIRTVEDRLRELGPSPQDRHRRAQLLHAVWDLFFFLCIAAMSLTYLALENDALRCSEERASARNASRAWFSNRHVDEPPPHCTAWSAWRSGAVWREVTVRPLEAGSAVFTSFFFISMCGNHPLAWLVGAGFASVTDPQWADFVGGVVEKWGHPFDGYSSYARPACRKRGNESARARERSRGLGRPASACSASAWLAMGG